MTYFNDNWLKRVDGIPKHPISDIPMHPIFKDEKKYTEFLNACPSPPPRLAQNDNKINSDVLKMYVEKIVKEIMSYVLLTDNTNTDRTKFAKSCILDFDDINDVIHFLALILIDLAHDIGIKNLAEKLKLDNLFAGTYYNLKPISMFYKYINDLIWLDESVRKDILQYVGNEIKYQENEIPNVKFELHRKVMIKSVSEVTKDKPGINPITLNMINDVFKKEMGSATGKQNPLKLVTSAATSLSGGESSAKKFTRAYLNHRRLGIQKIIENNINNTLKSENNRETFNNMKELVKNYTTGLFSFGDRFAIEDKRVKNSFKTIPVIYDQSSKGTTHRMVRPGDNIFAESIVIFADKGLSQVITQQVHLQIF